MIQYLILFFVFLHVGSLGELFQWNNLMSSHTLVVITLTHSLGAVSYVFNLVTGWAKIALLLIVEIPQSTYQYWTRFGILGTFVLPPTWSKTNPLIFLDLHSLFWWISFGIFLAPRKKQPEVHTKWIFLSFCFSSFSPSMGPPLLFDPPPSFPGLVLSLYPCPVSSWIDFFQEIYCILFFNPTWIINQAPNHRSWKPPLYIKFFKLWFSSNTSKQERWIFGFYLWNLFALFKKTKRRGIPPQRCLWEGTSNPFCPLEAKNPPLPDSSGGECTRPPPFLVFEPFLYFHFRVVLQKPFFVGDFLALFFFFWVLLTFFFLFSSWNPNKQSTI